MTTAIPLRLRAIRVFLEEEILPGVAVELRSDLRAVLKMLENMETEQDRLPALIESECQEMRQLCEAAIATLGDRDLSGDEQDSFSRLVRQRGTPADSLRDAHAEHAALTDLLGKLAGRLSTRSEAEPQDPACPSAPTVLFQSCCRFLQRQAEPRIGWQSVFPHGLYRDDSPRTDFREIRDEQVG